MDNSVSIYKKTTKQKTRNIHLVALGLLQTTHNVHLGLGLLKTTPNADFVLPDFLRERERERERDRDRDREKQRDSDRERERDCGDR